MTNDDSAEAFEVILHRTRPFGFYQKRLFVLTNILQSFCWTNLIYLDFINQHSWTVRHKQCSTTSNNRTNDSAHNVTQGTMFQFHNECTQSNVSEPKPPWTLPEWMTTQRPMMYEYIWYGQMLGIIAGCLSAGFLADLFGRKVVAFFMYGCMSLAQGFLVLSNHWFIFLCLRAAVGFFASGFMITSTVLSVEHVGKHWRDVTVCSGLWLFGVVVLSAEGWVTKHWQYLGIVTSATSFPLTGIYFISPESFRWYGCRQRFAESENAVRELASCNTTTLPDMTLMCDQARLAVLRTMHKRTHTFMDLFHTRILLKHSFAVLLGWFISCAVYRCLLERMFNLTGNSYMDVCLSFCIDLPVIYIAVLINKCIGRRWCLFLFATSTGFCLMCILVLHITNNLDEDKEMVTSISVFGKMGVSSTIALLAIITIETYPTAIRCMGISVGIVSGVCGCAVGRHLFHIFTKSFHYTLPYIGYGVMMILVGFSSLLLTETMFKPLPDLVPSRHRMIGMKEVTRSMNAWEQNK